MLRRLLGALLTVAAFAVPTALSACSDDGSTTQSTTLAFNTFVQTTVEATTTTTLAPLAYTVVSGDALSRIADDFCTSAAEIATLNGWSDGLQHVILPGQTIQIPAPGCPVVTTSTTIVMNKYLELYVSDGVVTNPFDPNTVDHVNWGPDCYAAYWAAHSFAVQGASKASVMAALEPLPGSIPSALVAEIDAWVVFSSKWYPVYADVRGRIEAEYPMYPNTDTFYRVLFSDPEYLTLLEAYEFVDDEQFAAKFFVTDLCADLFTTRGSTP
ncbi:MAG: LysM peptidoglycan-binding domain-containing protein [Actinomycetota bacterium]|nr:LysM peptidoglycan-binding domain-containing protein [Actinomycetota bacterium]